MGRRGLTKEDASLTVYHLTDDNERSLSDEEVKLIVDHVKSLDAEIRTLLRGTSTTLNLALVATALAVAVSKDVSADIALPALPILLGVAASYNFLTASDVAVLSEIRDRLTYRVNTHYGRPIFLYRLASDVRRDSRGTLALNGSLAFFYVMLSLVSIWYSGSRLGDSDAPLGGITYLVLVLASTVCVTVVVLLCFLDVKRDRLRITGMLDQVFHNKNRPESADTWRARSEPRRKA